MVSLQTSSGFHFCGASLVADDMVMTAAHCVTSAASSVFAVIGGHAVNDQNAESIVGSSWVVHPDYNSNTLANDIAFLRMSASVSPAFKNFVTLVFDDPIESTTYNEGTSSTCIGWGALSSGGSSPTILQEVDVPITSDSYCAGAYGSSFVASVMVCAGVPEGGIDSCQGDSGGPLLNTANPSVQIGVVSWGFGCADPGNPGVYTRLSAMESFVRSTLGTQVSPSPSPGPDELGSATTDSVSGEFHKPMLPGSYVVKVTSAGCESEEQTVSVPSSSLLQTALRLEFDLSCSCPSASPSPTPSPVVPTLGECATEAKTINLGVFAGQLSGVIQGSNAVICNKS
jgi:secreted trypsin-like serine protease